MSVMAAGKKSRSPNTYEILQIRCVTISSPFYLCILRIPFFTAVFLFFCFLYPYPVLRAFCATLGWHSEYWRIISSLFCSYFLPLTHFLPPALFATWWFANRQKNRKIFHIQGWQYLLARLRNQIPDTVCIIGKTFLGWYIVVFSDA